VFFVTRLKCRTPQMEGNEALSFETASKTPLVKCHTHDRSIGYNENMNFMWNIIVTDNNRYFEEYLDLVKSTILEKTETLNATAKKIQGMNLAGDEADRSDDYLSDLAYELEQLEQIMYGSFVMSIFAYMEARLVDLCKHIEKEDSHVFSHTDLRGQGANRAILYIEKVLKQKFPVSDDTREEFQTISLIRNALVHNEAHIKDNDLPRLSKLTSEPTKYLYLSQLGEVSFTGEYLTSLLLLNKKICSEITENTKVANW